MKVVNITNLRKNLQDIVDSVYYTKESVIIGKRGKPRVILTPFSEDDSKLSKAIRDFEDKA